MLVILSQRIDSESVYADELFKTYHYPARYRNQLHEGDVFIYYQGNRYDKSQRYYFGIGTVGEIHSTDGENYYAKLLNCKRFDTKVPIYLSDGGYVEQLDYQSVRKSINPPWQSSIRPLSQEAFSYIVRAAGIQPLSNAEKSLSLDDLKDSMKKAIRDFYVGNDMSAIKQIGRLATAIEQTVTPSETAMTTIDASSERNSSNHSDQHFVQLVDYCRNMRMSYSYKPLLIIALIQSGNAEGSITMTDAAKYFRSYYAQRRRRGLPAEKKGCIYMRTDATQNEIIANLIANPVNALLKSGCFTYNDATQTLSLSPNTWFLTDGNAKAAITDICQQRLDEYFSE